MENEMNQQQQELEKRIKLCKTMPELDALRGEVVTMMHQLGKSRYKEIQNPFRKQKNKLLRIPLRERTW